MPQQPPWRASADERLLVSSDTMRLCNECRRTCANGVLYGCHWSNMWCCTPFQQQADVRAGSSRSCVLTSQRPQPLCVARLPHQPPPWPPHYMLQRALPGQARSLSTPAPTASTLTWAGTTRQAAPSPAGRRSGVPPWLVAIGTKLLLPRPRPMMAPAPRIGPTSAAAATYAAATTCACAAPPAPRAAELRSPLRLQPTGRQPHQR